MHTLIAILIAATLSDGSIARRMATVRERRIIPPRLAPEPQPPPGVAPAPQPGAVGPHSGSPGPGATARPSFPPATLTALTPGGAPFDSAQDRRLDFPLRHTRVETTVAGNIARVELVQFFENPSSDKLEAIYAFPLPANAAVTSMFFRIGKRIVMSEVKERGEARATYEQARSAGKTAALTEQERPNLFTQSVANIPPHETVVVTLRYVHEVPYDSGRYQLVFPMTIGPRYIPGSGVADAARITPPTLPPGVRSGQEIELLVKLQPAGAFEDLSTESHRIVAGRDADGSWLISLAGDDRIPNKDFVLEYRPRGAQPEAYALAQRQLGEGYFMLFAQPPSEVTAGQVRPKEVVFLIDKSGSMSGRPIETAIDLIDRTLEGLGPEDTFQLMAFDGAVYRMSDSSLANNARTREAARRWLSQLSGGGGTEMLQGILAALRTPADPKRVRMVIFATDGYIGNEAEIIRAVRDERGQSRIFAFGIGSSVNRYLIEGMARAGAGAADVVLHDEDPEGAVARLYQRLDRPVLTDIRLTFEGLGTGDLLPDPVPDLFAGQPLVVVGKASGLCSGTLRVTGKVGAQPYERRIPLTLAAGDDPAPVLGTLWARRKIDALSWETYSGVSDQGRRAIVDLGLRFNLVTAYTSFVAVERELLAGQDLPLHTVLVPNEMPLGVTFAETAVSVTPARVKPGDPELRVRAPSWATEVAVDLPFGGLTKLAVRDPASGEHVVRFLVPYGWPDGAYQATVVLRAPGREERVPAAIKVDTTPAAVAVISAPSRVAPGGELVLKLKPALPAARVQLVGEALKSAMDVKEILVSAPWGVAEARMEGALGVYVARIKVPAQAPLGKLRLEVAASDAAGNVSRRLVEVEIAKRGGTGETLSLALGLAGCALALCFGGVRRRLGVG